MQLDHITYLAATDARGKQQAFGIKPADRSKHMYIIGKTGMGKSTLLENMAIQDIQHGEGLAFIDPHGSTAEKLLDYVPEHRIQDVIYFAPFDMGYPLAFNVMEDVGYDKRHLVVSGLMSAFEKIWVDAWSARMEYILTNTLLALLEYPGSTLLDVNKMLTNKAFRKKVVDYVTDPIVKDFWVGEFANYTDRYTQEATPAIQNKIGQFTSNPLIRNIIGQSKSSFDLREVMDNKKIFIANLSKGRMGETNADLLGSMLTTKIYLSAMSRADESAAVQAKLPSFYFYVDEFQSIANDSFADILSEARKYKLALTIAHQYVEQMEENVRNAVFGNVGTTIAFRVGPLDAELLETVFQPKFMAEDIVNLGFAQIYLTLMIDGVGSPPFSAVTLPPIEAPTVTFKDRVVKMSRDTYSHPREKVEETIRERNKDVETPQSISAQSLKQSPPRDNQPQRKQPPRNPSPIVTSPSPFPVSQESPRTEVEKKALPVSHSPQVPQKTSQSTVSLNMLKLKQYNNNNQKGPSPEQRSKLREALLAVQKSNGGATEIKPPQKIDTEQKKVPDTKPSQQETEQPPSIDTPREVPKAVLEKILKEDT